MVCINKNTRYKTTKLFLQRDIYEFIVHYFQISADKQSDHWDIISYLAIIPLTYPQTRHDGGKKKSQRSNRVDGSCALEHGRDVEHGECADVPHENEEIA